MGAGPFDLRVGDEERGQGRAADARRTSRQARIREAVLLLVLIVALVLPRVLTLDRFVTVDEHTWLARSANFSAALSRSQFSDTYQSEHPGVTAMWAGAVALRWQIPFFDEQAPAPLDSQTLLPFLQETGQEPIGALAAARLMMVAANSLALVLAYLFARSLLGQPVAFAGFMLIALDPFFLAHTQLLHLDGLMSSLMLLSLLAFLSFLQKRRLAALLMSGAAFSLSVLTKTPALCLAVAVLVISGALVVYRLWAAPSGSHDRRRLIWQHVWPLAVWAAVAIFVAIVAWPALWVAPGETVSRVVQAALAYANEGHESPLFFNGRVYEDGRLGPDFYALSFLWRTTPAVLLGLVAAVPVMWSWLRRDRRADPGHGAGTLAGVVLFVAVFVLQLTFSSKKFDRYLLPVLPPLALIAAAGWVGAATHLRRWPRFLPAVLGIALVLQLASAVSVFPYYLSYYNVLLGGTQRAPQAMIVGWGEGLEEAAAYLNEKPDADKLTVASWYGQVFSYFFAGETINIDNRADIDPEPLARLLQADYVVLYIHQWQRHLPATLIDIFAGKRPEYAVWINGLEYARVYRLSAGGM